MQKYPIRIKFGSGRTQVELEAQRVGRDWRLHVTGGRGHIGACAVGSRDPKSGRSFASVIALPGHKEGAWSLRMAERLARALRSTVLVTVGIHLDNIRRSEIKKLEKNTEELLEKFLRLLKCRNSG